MQVCTIPWPDSRVIEPGGHRDRRSLLYRANISLTQAGLVCLDFLKIIQSVDRLDLTEIY